MKWPQEKTLANLGSDGHALYVQPSVGFTELLNRSLIPILQLLAKTVLLHFSEAPKRLEEFKSFHLQMIMFSKNSSLKNWQLLEELRRLISL